MEVRVSKHSGDWTEDTMISKDRDRQFANSRLTSARHPVQATRSSQLRELGYPAGLIAVLFDKLDRLTDRWGSLLVFIGLLTIIATGGIYFSRETPTASALILAVFVVAVSAGVFVRLKRL